MTVVYPGAEGAFSHEACLRFLPRHKPVPAATFLEVVKAVQSGETDFGMLPLANSEAGETGARQLIDEASLCIVGQRMLAVRMHLLGLPNATLEQIRTVASHPIALRQCSQALFELGVRTEEASSTALAAKALLKQDRAALASEAAAAIYGLAILKRDLQNQENNATAFAILSRGHS